jgi:hypothetical protein
MKTFGVAADAASPLARKTHAPPETDTCPAGDVSATCVAPVLREDLVRDARVDEGQRRRRAADQVSSLQLEAREAPIFLFGEEELGLACRPEAVLQGGGRALLWRRAHGEHLLLHGALHHDPLTCTAE